MSFKDNLKTRIKADGLFGQLASTIKEPPGKRWMDKALTHELLAMTDFEYKKVSGLDLYTRPFEGGTLEVLVLDNELPIYHTTISDVVLRKAPYWQQMFSIRNIKKIMNHHDVLVTTGKESLNRIHENALALIDLTYTRNDLASLLEEARQGIDKKSITQIRESLDLFFTILDFQPVSVGVQEKDLKLFVRARAGGGAMPVFKHLVLFDEETMQLGLKKGTFSPQSDMDLVWVIQYIKGEKKADLQGPDVFAFLYELALEKAEAHQHGVDQETP